MRIFFYADEQDIIELLTKISQVYDYTYTIHSWFDSEQAPSFNSIDNFIHHIKETTGLRMYFATPPNNKIIPQRLKVQSGEYSGRIKYSINHGFSPDSVRLLFGQKCNDEVILRSTIDGFCETKASKAIFNSFKKIITKNSKKVGDIYLFAGAEKHYTNGWALTPNRGASTALHFQMS